MTKFEKYEDLFAEQGDFDIPENFGAGLAFQATPKLVFGFDIVRINYSKVKSIANGGPTTNMSGAPLGADNGLGFGWDDQTIYKLGAAYEINPAWTVRAGWNHADNPIPNDETLFNVLAPATVEDHLTLGATWTLKNKQEITFHYMHAFEKKIKGSNSVPAGFGGGEADIKMYQDAFGIAWAMPLD
jgi:long-chain fatty acid transport protein